MSIAYIGAGSNLGDRRENIAQACKLIEKNGLRILKQSSLIETDPVGGPPQGKFLNGVIQAETKLSPLELLKCLKEIESQCGRARTVRNGPRTVDLDILLFDDLRMRTEELTIPHPRMFERDFVKIPLREIAPELFEK